MDLLDGINVNNAELDRLFSSIEPDFFSNLSDKQLCDSGYPSPAASHGSDDDKHIRRNSSSSQESSLSSPNDWNSDGTILEAEQMDSSNTYHHISCLSHDDVFNEEYSVYPSSCGDGDIQRSDHTKEMLHPFLSPASSTSRISPDITAHNKDNSHGTPDCAPPLPVDFGHIAPAATSFNSDGMKFVRIAPKAFVGISKTIPITVVSKMSMCNGVSHISRNEGIEANEQYRTLVHSTPHKRTLSKVQPYQLPLSQRSSMDISEEESRKIRNRHFAAASRQRQKMATETMKIKVEILSKENDLLKKENTSLIVENDELRRRLGMPKRDVEGLFTNKSSMRTPIARALFVIGIVCTIGCMPVTLRNRTSTTPSHSRVLTDLVNTPLSGNVTHRCSNSSASNLTDYENLNQILDSWVGRHSQADSQFVRWGSAKRLIINETGSAPRTPSGEQKRENARLQAVRERAWKHLDLLNVNSSQTSFGSTNQANNGKLNNENVPNKITVSNHLKMDKIFEKLAQFVQQRKDILHLVSGQDYLLVPATSRDPISLPHISIVVPALSSNATSKDSTIAMLRIDCTVVATGIFNMPQYLLPFLN